MDEISDVQIEPLKQSQFVNPLRMKFKQNGKPRIWDLISLHESVCILIFNVERKKLIFVKQFRPAVFYNSMPKKSLSVSVSEEEFNIERHPGSQGLTIELCAGIVDKTRDLVVTAQTEVLEECGYKAPLNKFERIISFRAGVGSSGEKQTLFYAEVDESMKVSEGGGSPEEGEMIEVVEMTVEEVRERLKMPHVNSPSGFLFAVMWFLAEKAPTYSLR